MENTNPSSPLESPNSFRDRTILEINALLESLNLTAPPFDRDLSHLEGDVEFVELFKKYEIKDSRIVRFKNEIDKIAYKMPYKIEQFHSLSDMKKARKQSVYFRNEEDKRRGVDYVMNKILGFYKECLELGHIYLTGLEESSGSKNDAGVTLGVWLRV
nr:retrotransposon Orf1 [Tanacetum cinerariifolium]